MKQNFKEKVWWPLKDQFGWWFYFWLKFFKYGGFKKFGIKWVGVKGAAYDIKKKIRNKEDRERNKKKYGSGFLSSRTHIKSTLIQKGGRRCKICKQKFPFGKLTIDHILPVSKGGTNQKSNLQLLCQPCHYKKDFIKTDDRS